MAHRLYDGPLKGHLEKYFGLFSARLLVGPDRMVRSPFYPNWESRIRGFECRPSDVWVVTYPKAGTTWTQEIVWCILKDLKSKENEDILMKRFPFFEWDSLLPDEPSLMPPMEDGNPCKPGETWKIMQTLKEPRTLKSHLHLELLPKGIWTSKAKIVYVCRDPRDVCVSYYYHSIKLLGFTGEFSDYAEIFLNDLSFCSPYWKHVLSFWERRNDENILFIRYEELHENLCSKLKEISLFLGQDVSEEYLSKVREHVSFDAMKSNPAVNNESIIAFENERSKKIKFMRKGKVSDWKSHFTKEQLQKFQKWTFEALKDSDFPFYKDYDYKDGW